MFFVLFFVILVVWFLYVCLYSVLYSFICVCYSACILPGIHLFLVFMSYVCPPPKLVVLCPFFMVFLLFISVVVLGVSLWSTFCS